MASPEYEQLRKVLKPGLAIPSDPPELVREKMHRIHPTKFPGDVTVTRTTLGGVPAAWVDTPESAGSTRVLLHVHGGAFVSTGVEHYVPYAARLSRPFASRVLVFGYRLAPEHRYPAAPDATHAPYPAPLDPRTPPARTATAGDPRRGAAPAP